MTAQAQPAHAEAGTPVTETGDWLVVPGPLHQHEWRWGRIREVLTVAGLCRYRVRWLGDKHDSVVLPPPGSRIEKAADWPHPGGDAIGVWPT